MSTFLETGPMPNSTNRLPSLGNKYLHSAIRKAVSVLPGIRYGKRRQAGPESHAISMHLDEKQLRHGTQRNQKEKMRISRYSQPSRRIRDGANRST